jgi:hypothetical protein
MSTAWLSDNFTLAEFLDSDTANAEDIDNSAPWGHVEQLHRLALVMEQVRNICGDNVVMISSGYRCPELNAAVGGVPDSAHAFGCACDFTIPGFGDVTAVCRAIEPYLDDLGIDQLIDESGGGVRWVHLGLPVPPAEPRCQCLTINSQGTTSGFG